MGIEYIMRNLRWIGGKTLINYYIIETVAIIIVTELFIFFEVQDTPKSWSFFINIDIVEVYQQAL